MCNLQDEPWRADFTGPPCRCGVPTAGTLEESLIHKKHRDEAKVQRLVKHKAEIAEYKRVRGLG